MTKTVRQRDRAARIEVWKGQGQRYHSDLHRSDGVRIRLEGGSYNKVVGAAAQKRPARAPRHDIRDLPEPQPGPPVSRELAAMRDSERF